nr:aminoglycoside 6-adenylyltransferase [Clostridium tepidiprofundi]
MHFTSLMQFTDGNRIDLHIQPMEVLKKEYGTDKLTVPLLDKDNCLPQIPAHLTKIIGLKKLHMNNILVVVIIFGG